MLGELPLMTAIKSRLQYHQSRQKLLAENVANADSPGYKPRDLKPISRAVRRPLRRSPVIWRGPPALVGSA